MGVPVITLRGRRHAARLSASVLTSVGNPEWIAENADGYVDLAVRLAGDLPALAASYVLDLAHRRRRISPCCDAATFTRGLEANVPDGLWRDWCDAK